MEPIPEPISDSSCIQSEESASAEQQQQGILLYYKYVDLKGSDADDVARFYEDLCARLDQRGRIRVARDGVNVTVGGTIASLRAHSAEVTAHPLLLGADIDFKMQTSPGPRNVATRQETGMEKLVVRLCEELVTLGPLARHRADPRVSTAPHLTPEQFHNMIARAAQEAQEAAQQPPPQPGPQAPAPEPPAKEAAEVVGETAAAAPEGGVAAAAAAVSAGPLAGGEVAAGDEGGPLGSVVLLDTRNLYETRIGHFEASARVPTLDPCLRCFSELPAWLDCHAGALRHRTVLMYCTGGVRCERASAYLREKGPGFDRVFQLSGGIQRYLERFPDGGFFRGKNFLYDDRIAVGPETVVGRCLLCGCDWDDYGRRLRCSRCRLLLLVCDSCCEQRGLTAAAPPPVDGGQLEQADSCGTAAPAPSSPASPGAPGAATTLLCELCAAAGGCGGGGGCGNSSNDRNSDGPPQQQWGDALRTTQPPACAGTGPAAAPAAACCGRDGPGGSNGNGEAMGKDASSGHPAVSRAALAPAAAVAAGGGTGVAGSAAAAGGGEAAPRRLRILCLHGFRQTGKQFQGRTCALRKKLRDLADFVFLDAPHLLPLFVKDKAAQPASAPAVVPAVGDAVGDAATGGAAADVADASSRMLFGDDVCFGGVDEDADVSSGGAGDGGVADAPAAGKAPPVSPPPAAVAKRAWLLPPELYRGGGGGDSVDSGNGDGGDGGWCTAPSYVDELQYIRQTEGWRESLAVVQKAVAEQGPFDGVFGFSQGAAVAAVLCALQQQHRQRLSSKQQASATLDTNTVTAADAIPSAAVDTHHSSSSSADCQAIKDGDTNFGFRFAVLASGFPSPCAEHAALFESLGPLELPSLHVYGSPAAASAASTDAVTIVPADADATAEGVNATAADAAAAGSGDRQIPPCESERLMAAFAAHSGSGASACAGAGVGVGSSNAGSGSGGDSTGAAGQPAIGGYIQLPQQQALQQQQQPLQQQQQVASQPLRRCVRHQCGHLIPATRSHAAAFRAFLQQFLLA